MNIVLDLLLIGLVVFCIVHGVRRGFVENCAGLATLVLAVVLILSFSAPLGEKLDEKWIRPWAAEKIVKAGGAEKDSPAVELDLVKSGAELEKRFGLKLAALPESEQTAGEYVEEALKARSVTAGAARAAAGILLFLIAVVGVLILRLVLRPILRLPVLKQANRLLGAAIGVVNALILAFLLCTGIYAYAHSVDQSYEETVVNQTAVFQIAYHHNPILSWIEK